MNAYKRYQKRKAELRMFQVSMIVEMAKSQTQLVLSRPYGFGITEGERKFVKLQKALEIAQIAVNTAQAISKIYP